MRRSSLWRLAAAATTVMLLLSACGSGDSLPDQPWLPAINADPPNAPVGAATGVNVCGLS
jgi:hypothetical protein